MEAAHLCVPKDFGGFDFKLVVHSSKIQQELRVKPGMASQSVILALGRQSQGDQEASLGYMKSCLKQTSKKEP